MSFYSRRKFLRNLSLAAISVQGLSVLPGCGGPVKKEENKEEHMNKEKANGKIGIALVGLGQYATDELAPALSKTQHCYLAGVVTGSPDKAEAWKKKYSLPDRNIYDYTNFDSIKDNPDIDIIYVVLPNSMHAEYVVRAAKAGKHVICEKPMAITAEECDLMIDACKQAGKLLSIGYRLHFDPYNKEMMRLGQQKVFGPLKKVRAEDAQKEVKGWRLVKEMAGGGPLMDLGIYCVQGIRYTTGLEPIAVTAKEGPKTDPQKFKTIEETVNFQLEMPGGITADAMCSYSQEASLLRAEAEKGWFQLSPAFGYKNLKGESSAGKIDLPQAPQQALQMDDFAVAIKEKRPTPVPGEMGRQDVKILQAIYRAMASGKRELV
jgi:predicted dehydrogenase